MPLEKERGPSYVKVTKIHVDSSKRNTTDSKSVTDYVIVLEKAIQYVIGMEITAYDMPRSLTPSFTAQQDNIAGTNKIDFELSANSGAVIQTFSVTLPQRKFTYQNLSSPLDGYVNTLEMLLNDAIASDGNFGEGGTYEATFTVVPTADQSTRVDVSGTGVDGFRFLFDSGSNQANSAYSQMGFTKVDGTTATTQESPNSVNLDTHRYVDVFIEEVPEFKPVERLYLNPSSSDSVLNNLNINRTRLLTDPVHRLRTLRIRLSLPNGASPPSTSSEEHGFTLTVTSLSNETSVPAWVNQTFTL